jgi:hypothetical protein
MKRKIIIALSLIAVLINTFFFLRSESETSVSNQSNSMVNLIKSENTWSNAISSSNAIMEAFKKDWKEFDIDRYEMNQLNKDVFKDCSNYINMSSGSNFNMAKFLNAEIWNKIDFAVKLDCEKPWNADYCKFLKEYKTIKEVTLDDDKFWLYALYNKDLSYVEFKTLFSDMNRVQLTNIWPDMKYTELYADMINWKLKTLEDCIKLISRKWNTLLK